MSYDRHKGFECPVIAERTGGIAVELLKNPVTTQANAAAGLSGKDRENVGKASGMILDACRETPSITIAEIAKRIGITERSVQRNIQKLQSAGLLRRMTNDLVAHFEQRLDVMGSRH